MKDLSSLAQLITQKGPFEALPRADGHSVFLRPSHFGTSLRAVLPRANSDPHCTPHIKSLLSLGW
uniref:Uncharacterized protein n=1 Tax=Utricularia reniformis TaxID=192314 RepID=A0A1Y0B400_9LAMI|nr:hypothetical protein AEK19_MT1943 [Utricularia reniformis]ART32107.1 hypothetical protein AEK19_MT1943 [Utricularia reniformis]